MIRFRTLSKSLTTFGLGLLVPMLFALTGCDGAKGQAENSVAAPPPVSGSGIGIYMKNVMGDDFEVLKNASHGVGRIDGTKATGEAMPPANVHLTLTGTILVFEDSNTDGQCWIYYVGNWYKIC